MLHVPHHAPGRAELSIRSSDGGHVIATYSPLLLVCFTRSPQPPELDLMAAIAAQGIDSGVRGGLLYVFARKELRGGIDPRARETLESMTRRNAERAGSSAVVVLTTGFGGAIVRGALAGLLMLTKNRKLVQVFSDPDEACTWLAAEHHLDAEGLRAAYRRAVAGVQLPEAAAAALPSS